VIFVIFSRLYNSENTVGYAIEYYRLRLSSTVGSAIKLPVDYTVEYCRRPYYIGRPLGAGHAIVVLISTIERHS